MEKIERKPPKNTNKNKKLKINMQKERQDAVGDNFYLRKNKTKLNYFKSIIVPSRFLRM